MRALIPILAFIGVVVAIGYMVSFTRSSLGSRRDRKRLERERAAALQALSNIRDLAHPYVLMTDGAAALLADAVLTEIRKTDDILRKELT